VQEKKDILKQVIARGLDPQNIIMSCNGCCCVQDAAELAQAALEHNCLACMITPPCYFKNRSAEGIIAFYRQVIKRVNDERLRIIVYYGPQLSDPPTILTLLKTLVAEFPDVVIGFKESDNNLALVKDILELFPTLKVFVGEVTQFPKVKEFGAAGIITGSANVTPEFVLDVYKTGLFSEWPRTTPAPFTKRHFIETLKGRLCNAQSPHWNLTRPPFVAYTDEEIELLKNG